MLVTSVLIISGCVNAGSFGNESEARICKELNQSLFTMAEADTELSKQGYADFLDVFEAVCTG